MSGTVEYRRQTTVSKSYCDEYQAVYDAMTNKPTSTIAGYQNTMVEDLVDGGYWTGRMELFYVFAQYSNSDGEALINWYDPGTYNLTDPTSVSWTSLKGFDGNGSSNYLSTGWNPNDNAKNVSQNSFTVGGYLKDDAYGIYALLGCRNGSNYLRFYPYLNATSSSITINSGLAQNATTSTRLGLMISTRRASEEQETYLNGESLEDNGSGASTGLPDYPLDLFCYNYNGTRSAYYDGVVSIIFIMDAVSDADVIAINTIIEAYMDAIGEGVQ